MCIIAGFVFLLAGVAAAVIVLKRSTAPPPLPEQKGNTATSQPSGGCVVTGCSGNICADEEVITTCEFRPEYACYKDAVCARQPDGACGWTETPRLTDCLRASRKEE